MEGVILLRGGGGGTINVLLGEICENLLKNNNILSGANESKQYF